MSINSYNKLELERETNKKMYDLAVICCSSVGITVAFKYGADGRFFNILLSYLFLIVLVTSVKYIIKNKYEHLIKYIFLAVMAFVPPMTESLVAFYNLKGDGTATFVIFAILIIPTLYHNYKLIVLLCVEIIVLYLIGFMFFYEQFVRIYTIETWTTILVAFIVTTYFTIVSVRSSVRIIEYSKSNEQKSIEATKSLQKVLFRIKENILTLKQESQKITSALNSVVDNSEQISITSNDISNSALAQAKKTEFSFELTRILDERINSMIFNCKNAIVLTEKMKQSSDLGVISINDLKDNFNKNTIAIENANDNVNRLLLKSKNIYNILNTLKQISDAIDLLSMNASIEAARSGEAGHGFAIIAEEINALSNSSAVSSAEIKSILNDIISNIENTEKDINKVKDLTMESNNKLEKTNSIFSNFKNISEEQMDHMKKIENDIANVSKVQNDSFSSIEYIASIAKEHEKSTKNVNLLAQSQVSATKEMSQSLINLEEIFESLKEEA